MNERKGWMILWLGVGLFLTACLGVSVTAFLWGSTLMERIF